MFAECSPLVRVLFTFCSAENVRNRFETIRLVGARLTLAWKCIGSHLVDRMVGLVVSLAYAAGFLT